METAATARPPRILAAYVNYPCPYGDVAADERRYLELLRAGGIDIEGFCLTLNPPGPALRFDELDALWRRADPALLAMYEKLEAALDGFDVLLNESGVNLHPEFVTRLPVFTVFQCFDDPDSSEHLSRPAAHAYDLCLVGNIAEVETYRSWGIRNAVWRPHGLYPGLYTPGLTEDDILSGERPVDLFMMSDRLSPWRKARLDQLAEAFPDAHFYGKGWPRGYLSREDEMASLRRAKIGPNLHNSTGPVNTRTYYLPANGVMQVCDNKSHVARIFELGKEVAGFDTVKECVDLCRYYLAHDEERRRIAAAGWRRAVTDYTELAVFRRVVSTIADGLSKRAPRASEKGIAVAYRRGVQRRERLRRLARKLKPRVPWRLREAVRRLRAGRGGAGPAPSDS